MKATKSDFKRTPSWCRKKQYTKSNTLSEVVLMMNALGASVEDFGVVAQKILTYDENVSRRADQGFGNHRPTSVRD